MFYLDFYAQSLKLEFVPEKKEDFHSKINNYFNFNACEKRYMQFHIFLIF